jgi:hypothetical protein
MHSYQFLTLLASVFLSTATTVTASPVVSGCKGTFSPNTNGTYPNINGTSHNTNGTSPGINGTSPSIRSRALLPRADASFSIGHALCSWTTVLPGGHSEGHSREDVFFFKGQKELGCVEHG